MDFMSQQAAKRLSAQDWVREASKVLISRGVDEVKVDRLAKSLSITRGSFYWHFKSREELLDRVLEAWDERHAAFLEEWGSEVDGQPGLRLWKLMNLWARRDKRVYFPEWHAALQAWAKRSPKVAAMYRRQEKMQVEALARMFAKLGFDEVEAPARARITHLFFESHGYFVGQTGAPLKERLHHARRFFELVTEPALDGVTIPMDVSLEAEM
jgi:AcrR family transcriptional regulator